MALLIPLVFLLVLTTITAAGYVRYVRQPSLLDRLNESLDRSLLERRGGSLFERISRLLERAGDLFPLSPQEKRMTQAQLGFAGYRSESAIPLYQGVRISGAVILLAADLLLRNRVFSNHVLSMISIVGAPALGYFGPGLIVDWMAGRRADKIRYGLPDMLDLLVVCTEAGSGLDQAMMRVSVELREAHPALSEELSMVNFEMLAGKSREDTLRNLAARTREPELGKLTQILIQADRFGTSIADTLRTQSEFMRTRRRQEAQERAGKVGVKIIFPIFFFCFPSMLIIVAGPGMLLLAKTLLPMMAKAH